MAKRHNYHHKRVEVRYNLDGSKTKRTTRTRRTIFGNTRVETRSKRTGGHYSYGSGGYSSSSQYSYTPTRSSGFSVGKIVKYLLVLGVIVYLANGGNLSKSKQTQAKKVSVGQKVETTSKSESERSALVQTSEDSVTSVPAEMPESSVSPIPDSVWAVGPTSLDYSQISEDKLPTGIWATKYTDLSSFEFFIDGDYIFLKDHYGDEEKIWLSLDYEYEGKQYKLSDTLNESRMSFTRATSIIIPEGITTLSGRMFLSDTLKYVYIPQSIEKEKANLFYRGFDNIEILFYGGSETDWLQLTDGTDRKNIDVKQIVYNVDYESFIASRN